MLRNPRPLFEPLGHSMVSLDHFRRPLTDHHGWRGHVPRYDFGHHREVNNPQIGHAVNPQLGVRHSSRIIGRTHGTGGHVVCQLVCELAGEAFPIRRTVDVRVLTAFDRFGKVLKVEVTQMSNSSDGNNFPCVP